MLFLVSANFDAAWDMHDELYEPQVPMMKNQTGFADIVAKIDLSTKRIDPLTNVPHYLVDFYDPKSGKPIPMCCRSLLKKVIGKYTDIIPQTGMELEFFNFRETPESLTAKEGSNLIPLTSGMFGYSLMRPAVNQAFFDQVYDKCKAFDIPLECFHTETGRECFDTRSGCLRSCY
jgi:glutamine synthetase